MAYLALQPSAVPRPVLHALLWPEAGKGGLRVALSRVRHLPGAGEWLERDGHLVRLRADSDVARFEAAIATGEPNTALELWPTERGSLLAGVEVRHAQPFMEWLATERSRLQRLRNDARRALLARLEQAGSQGEALALARALLADDELDEAAHRSVMRLEHARHNTEGALVQFERLRLTLRQDLGVEPSGETLAELARIEGGAGTAAERARLLEPGDDVPGRAAWMVGREEALREAEDLLRTRGRVLVHGAGGMGKSALVAELAARRLQARERVAWVRSGDGEPNEVFDALAAALGARSEVARAASPAPAVRHVLASEHVGLVVLDDASNAYAVSRSIDALPEGCGLVVTSRQRYPGLERIRLGRLGRQEARELLEFHAGRVIPESDTDALCALLGDHPYAVRIAGVALSADGRRVERLMARVREAPHALALPDDLAEPGRESVAALLEVSLEELPDHAHEALMGLGALSLPAVTPELLAELTRRDAGIAEDGLNALQARALAERLVEPGSDIVRYRVHDLTHSLARANTHFRSASARRACLRFLERHFEDHDLLDAELAQIVTAVRATLDQGATGDAVRAMVRLCGLGGYFNGRGHTPASLALLEQVATAAEDVDASYAQTLHVKLGNGRRELLADLAGGRESYRRAADLAHAIGDACREVIARSAMGSVDVALGNDEGEGVVRAALGEARRMGDDLALAHTLQNLSYVAGLKGRHADAAALSAEAIAAADRLGPEIDRQEADHKRFFSRFNLGVARWQGGDLDDGRAALEDALGVAREQGNPGWEAYALQELADLEDAAGHGDAAVERAREALRLYERHRRRRDAQALRVWLAERGALR